MNAYQPPRYQFFVALQKGEIMKENMSGYEKLTRRTVLRGSAALGGIGLIGASTVTAGGTDYNDANRDAGRPHINLVDIDGWKVTIEFVNPHTGWPWAWDVRVDGAEGTEDNWTGQTISQGPLKGEDFGLAYERVSLGPDDDEVRETRTFQATELVEVILRRGPEQMWYVPSREFEPEQPETPDDCRQGGYERFGFRNQGRCIQYVNTGKDSR